MYINKEESHGLCMNEVFVYRYAYPGKDRSKKQMPGLRSAKGMICLRVNLHSLCT